MDSAGLLDQVTLQFLQALQQDGKLLQGLTKNLFYYLAVIQLTITAIWLSLSGASLQNLFIRLVQMIIGFTLFYTCIEMGSVWIPFLLNGFVEIGQQSGIQSLSPSGILSQGLSIAGSIGKSFFNWGILGHPFVSMVGSICCLSVVILYALIAAELTIVLVKSYVLTALSSFFFALGVSEITRPMTMSYLKTVVGIGLKLMTLYFLLSAGQSLGKHWAELTTQASNQHELMPMFAILAGVIVFYMVIKNVPGFIAGLSGVGGFHNEGDATVAMTINTAMRGSRTASSTAQRTGKTIQSVNQTVEAIKKGFVVGQVATGTTATMALKQATIQSVKDSINKTESHKSFGQKVNAHLTNRIKKEIKDRDEERFSR